MNHILIIYLGSKGGGVLDTYEITEALTRVGSNSYSLLISQNNPFRERYGKLPFKNLFVVKTHKPSMKDFILQSVLLKRIFRIVQAIRKDNPSTVFITMIHPWVLPVIIYLKAFIPGKKIVYIQHNPGEFESGVSAIQNIILEKLEKILINSSDRIFTLSSAVKEEIAKAFKLPLNKIHGFSFGAHHAVCSGWRHSGFYKEGVLRLLFFGRILKYKGVDVLTEAYRLMKDENLPIRLTIAGEGTIDGRLIERIKELGIRLLNYWISDDALCRLLSDTDIIVLPYKKASQSGPASIAVALGIPAIATKVGGLTEQIHDNVNGFLVEPNSPEGILIAVKRILEDTSILSRFSEGARLLKENQFSWDTIVAGMDKVFYEM
jgi:glycosyltransferase involved in cell wall biosynthesis